MRIRTLGDARAPSLRACTLPPAPRPIQKPVRPRPLHEPTAHPPGLAGTGTIRALSPRLASTGGGDFGTSLGSGPPASGRCGGNRPASVQHVVAERNEQSGSTPGVVEEDRVAATHPQSSSMPGIVAKSGTRRSALPAPFKPGRFARYFEIIRATTRHLPERASTPAAAKPRPRTESPASNCSGRLPEPGGVQDRDPVPLRWPGPRAPVRLTPTHTKAGSAEEDCGSALVGTQLSRWPRGRKTPSRSEPVA